MLTIMNHCNKCGKDAESKDFKRNTLCKVCANRIERERRDKCRDAIHKAEHARYIKRKEVCKVSEQTVAEAMPEKECTVCRKMLSIDNFFFAKTRSTYRSECKDCAKLKRSKHYQENKARINKQTDEYKLWKLANNEDFKIERQLRNKLWRYVTVPLKTDPHQEFLSAKPSFVRKWIEFQFNESMSWDNYGTDWHIDHVKPCSLFKCSNPADVIACFHWMNLRPFPVMKNLQRRGNHYCIYDTLLQEVKAHTFKKLRHAK